MQFTKSHLKDAADRARRQLITPYLTTQDLESLSQYKYHSSGATKLDNILNKIWWTPVSELIPKTIHPNVLTVIAFICSLFVSYLPLLFFSPDFQRPCPRFVHLMVVIGFFAYQTLDAIDGKQARRIGLSSPTGQMMDHGCDSLTTFYSMFIVLASVQLGTGRLATLMVVAMTIQLYLYSWWEVTYGVFRSCTGSYLGVTEGQFFLMFLNVVAIWDPVFWTKPVGWALPGLLGSVVNFITFNEPISSYLYVLGCGSLYYMISQDVSDILFKQPPKDKRKAIKEWAQIGLQTYTNAALFLGGVVARHAFLATMTMAAAGSLMAWRLILSCVSGAPLRLIQWPSYPYLVVSILASARLLPGPLEFIALFLTWLWTSAALLTFILVNMTLIRDHLGISLFTVPTPDDVLAEESEMRQREVRPQPPEDGEPSVTPPEEQQAAGDQLPAETSGAETRDARAAEIEEQSKEPAPETEERSDAPAAETVEKPMEKVAPAPVAEEAKIFVSSPSGAQEEYGSPETIGTESGGSP